MLVKLPAYWLLLGGLLAGRLAMAQTDTTLNQIPEQLKLRAATITASTTAPIVLNECFPPEPELLSGGGLRGITAAIRQRIVFPQDALGVDFGSDKRAIVSFSITPAGTVERIRVIKSLWPSCDSAVVRAVRQLPRFKSRPAQYGDISFTTPITFQSGHKRPATRRAKLNVIR